MAHARELAKVPGLNLLAQELMHRLPAHEVAGLEDHAGRVDGGGHALGVGAPQPQRLLDKKMFARRGGRRHQRFVAVGLGADDHARDRGVVPRSRRGRRLWRRPVPPRALRRARRRDPRRTLTRTSLRAWMRLMKPGV
jgi:hypothetical protein